MVWSKKTRFMKPRKKPRTKKAHLTKPVRVAITRMINRREETKMAEVNFFSSALYCYNGGNASNFLTNNLYTLTPSVAPELVIVQGTGQAGRIGNEITTVKGLFRSVIYPAPYDGTTNPAPIPCDIRVIVFKILNQSVAPATLFANYFWQTGSASTALTGDINDMVYQPNLDYMKVYRDFRVKVGTAISNGSGSSMANQYYANNDYKYNRLINLNLKPPTLPKLMKFNDGTTTTTVDPVYVVFIPAPADGSISYTTGGQYPLIMTSNYLFHFKDA